MSAARIDRRGDRRLESSTTCRATRAPLGPTVGPGNDAPIVCGGELMEQGTHAGVLVVCRACGRVDRRSTLGNRRRAELELRQLLERIERELAASRDRLESVESSTEYLTERVDGHGSKLEDVRHELHGVARKAESAEYTAEEAKREAERARASAERAGRGW